MQAPEVQSIVKKYRGKPWALISILQDVQERAGFLSQESLREVARGMGIGLAEVYGVATYFKSLHLTPQGRHQVTVCLGTACHVRGGARIVAEINDMLGIGPDETTDDGEFTLRVVNCVGACAIGPVVVVDGKYHGEMSPASTRRLLARHRRRKHAKAQERV